MNEFIVLVGPPGCGKTTYRNKYLNDYVILSSDDIRKELFNSENLEKSQNNIVFEELDKRLRKNLSKNKNIVFDATNMTRKMRINLLDKINKNYKKTCLLFATVPALSEDRVYKRSKNDWDENPKLVTQRLLKTFQTPTLRDGFDEVKIIWDEESLIYLNSDKFDIECSISNLLFFNQENHNHTQTLGNHILAASTMAYRDRNYELALVGLLHDLGKEFSKVFTNMKGEVTEDAHYYGHESVSAFLSLFYLKRLGYSDEKILHISDLVSLHMMSFNKLNKKTILKYNFTEKLINYVKLFNHYDHESRDINYSDLSIVNKILDKNKKDGEIYE